MKGLFIALEGIDGSGKTTLAQTLVQKINFCKVNLYSENSYPLIKQIMLDITSDELVSKYYDPYAHLFLSLAEYIILLKSEVLSKLEQGEMIIFDRYYHSSIAYSVPLGIDYLWLNKFWKFLRRPDLVIYCTSDPESSWRRKAKIDNIESGCAAKKSKNNFIEFQKKVCMLYQRLSRDEKENYNSQWLDYNAFNDKIDDLINYLWRLTSE